MSGEAARRHIERYGHDVVLINYTLGGKDDYEDATMIATSSTVRAIRKMGWSDTDRDPGGAVPTGRVSFHFKDTIEIYDSGTTYPSEIVDDGLTFTVHGVDDQRNGQLTVTAERNGA